MLWQGKGGIGGKGLEASYKVLLCKWSRRFVVEREALWKKFICEEYGEEEEGGRMEIQKD